MSQALIGAQMYTLRDYCETPTDIARSCRKVREMGYDGIQASAAGFSTIDPNELRKILDGEGLACPATHIALDRMRDEPEAVIEQHQILGCEYTAIGGFFKQDPTLADWQQFAADYNAIAKKYAGSSLKIGYHNHSHELAHYEGRPVLDLLIEQLDPSVWFEIDTYWIAHGGGDPIQWIRKVAGRIPCVHVKDMGITKQREQFMAEVGSGNLNWEGILPACQDAGVEWYLVERDQGELDPFESLKISLDNMRAMGL